MKKFISMMVLFVALVMSVSCTKDDISSGDLVGTWEATEVTVKMTIDGKSQSATVEMGPGEMIWSFYSDGTTEIDSDLLELYGEGTYKVNGSTVTITIEGDPQDFTIKKLESKKLVLYMTYVEDGVKVEMTMSFRKI